MVRVDRALLSAGLARLDEQHLRRERRLVEALRDPADPTRVQLDGRWVRNFCSNDYLGLASHPALTEAATDCMRRFGFGAGASHLVCGHTSEHHALEEELAAFVGRERALLFSSGYLANLGVLSALCGRHETVVADRLCHASLLDGAQLAGARLRRFAHVDVGAAERLLEQAGPGALLLTDGVFSMDGDLAPLPALAAAAARQRAVLLVDDAHGLGVVGTRGRGTLEESAVPADSVPLLIGTLGKALGSVGAFVAGEATLIEHLLQRARTYIYTTALPPAAAAATRAALHLLETESWRRERLRQLIDHWRTAARAASLPLAPSSTPIQPLIMGDAAAALELSAALLDAGFWVAAIRPPTVPAGSARLRITLSAAHEPRHLDALLERLTTLWPCYAAAKATAP